VPDHGGGDVRKGVILWGVGVWVCRKGRVEAMARLRDCHGVERRSRGVARGYRRREQWTMVTRCSDKGGDGGQR